MNKFEQLIEYVINDEEQKARELFHEIVVEKSRLIYEEMMQEESEEEIEEADEEEVEEGREEIEEAEEEEELEENLVVQPTPAGGATPVRSGSHANIKQDTRDRAAGMEEGMGGDQADDLIDDIEVEEEGMMEMEDDADLEDRVVDLEDKLDELMAEFEALMGDEEMDDMDDMDDGDMGDAEVDMDMELDTDGMDAEEVEDDELETEGMNEAVSLKSAPAPVKSEESGINKKAVYAANSGAKGAVAKPVHAGANEGGHHDTAAYRNSHKDLIGKVGNTPAQSTQKPSPATKPHLGQASGVNNKSVIQ